MLPSIRASGHPGSGGRPEGGHGGVMGEMVLVVAVMFGVQANVLGGSHHSALYMG